MTKTWTQTPPKTMTNGWFCTKCKQLTEHIIKYKKSNDHTHTSRRNLVCVICKESTVISVTKNSYREKLTARLGSRRYNLEIKDYGDIRGIRHDFSS